MFWLKNLSAHLPTMSEKLACSGNASKRTHFHFFHFQSQMWR